MAVIALISTQGSRMRNQGLSGMEGSKTARPRRRSEERLLPNRSTSLPSGLSYRSDLMREPWVDGRAMVRCALPLIGMISAVVLGAPTANADIRIATAGPMTGPMAGCSD